MSNEPHPANSNGNGGYERRDIGVAGVLYFLLGLAVAGLLVYFLVDGIVLTISTNAPKPSRLRSIRWSRTLPRTRATSRKTIRRAHSPIRSSEEDERGQLNRIRLKEEQTLSTYDYIDKNAGTVRIPIDRAMDLIAQRGLPVRAQSAAAKRPRSRSPRRNKKGTKK